MAAGFGHHHDRPRSACLKMGDERLAPFRGEFDPVKHETGGRGTPDQLGNIRSLYERPDATQKEAVAKQVDVAARVRVGSCQAPSANGLEINLFQSPSMRWCRRKVSQVARRAFGRDAK
ncbi:MAG: hypothetical protein ACT4P0_05340 [Panacagrimonas sp.]